MSQFQSRTECDWEALLWVSATATHCSCCSPRPELPTVWCRCLHLASLRRNALCWYWAPFVTRLFRLQGHLCCCAYALQWPTDEDCQQSGKVTQASWYKLSFEDWKTQRLLSYSVTVPQPSAGRAQSAVGASCSAFHLWWQLSWWLQSDSKSRCWCCNCGSHPRCHSVLGRCRLRAPQCSHLS